VSVEPLSEAWVAALVAASEAVPVAGRRSAVVEFAIGKKTKAVVVLGDGRVTGPGGDDTEPELTVPVTGAQLQSYCDGSASMSTDYMRGDFKPVGPTAAILALVELFDHPDFIAALADQLAD
jgi:hypothetical protein